MLRAGVRRGVILGITLGGVAIGMLWRMTVAQTQAGYSRLYRSTDTHADPILIGCAAAIALRVGITHTRGAGWPSIVILGALLARAGFPAFVYHVSTAVALLSAALIVDLVQRPGSWLARALALGPLAALGRISYGVYLWHFPVFYGWGALYTPGLKMAPWPALAWATTLAVAIVSYWALERPVLAYKATVRPTPSYAVPDPVSP
jgi:peptidoglycan/LPS O-acetylase OafA/YrhL